MLGKGEEAVWLSTAEHFRLAAIKLKKDIPLGEIPVGRFVPPSVNAAFAVELYLKYILHKQGWKRRKQDKHDIKALFYQLQGDLRVSIVSGIYLHYARHHPGMPFDLDFKLEENKNVFHEWRYIHEFIGEKVDLGMGVDYGFLMNFCGILKAAADTFEK